MPNIFISYSRATKETALRIRRDLQLNGITDIFLDLDPIDGLRAGSIWERELRKNVFASKAVLLLVSKAWLASKNCIDEYRWARNAQFRASGKKRLMAPRKKAPTATMSGYLPVILPILLSDVDYPDLAATPVSELGGFNAHKLKDSLEINPDAPGELGMSDDGVRKQLEARRGLWEWLKNELERAGVTPVRVAFKAGQAPYPGLEAFKEADASVFFGREAEADAAIKRLLDMRRRRGRNVFVIQGASGAGKSSVLRAGVLSRLKLGYEKDFYCLPALRPGLAAMTSPSGFVNTLVEAYKPLKNYPPDLYHDPKTNKTVRFPRLEAFPGITQGVVKEALRQGTLVIEQLLAGLQVLASPANESGGVVDPITLVLPIDQAEELFPVGEKTESVRQQHEEAEGLRRLLAALLRPEARRVNLMVVMAIRSDSYPRLQADPILGGTVEKEPFDLSPLPAAAYRSVIEGPAQLAKLEIDAALISALIKDLDGVGDALPLLAFVLRRLYNVLEQKPAELKTRIALADYNGAEKWALGGVQGAIQKVVDEALGKDVDEDLLRRLFVGHLATIDPQSGQFLRRIGRASEFPEGGRNIAEKLKSESARILMTRDNADEYEVAHEAVLRKWEKLNDWLEKARGALLPVQEAREAAKLWRDARAPLVEGSFEAADHDWDNLWPQKDLDRVLRGLEALGLDRGKEPEPMRSFLRPEFDRLLEQLGISALGHARRAEIGDRLALLGERTVHGNKTANFGDLRPGVNVFTPSRIAVLKGMYPREARGRQLEHWARLLERKGLATDAEHPLGEDDNGLPDIVWCKVPPGEVVIQRDETALIEWAKNKETGNSGDGGASPVADPSPPQKIPDNLWIAKYPITLAQFIAFTGAGANRPERYKDKSWWAGFPEKPEKMNDFFNSRVQEQSGPRNRPAQYVTWYQGVAYCRWLTRQMRDLRVIPDSAEIRLPFEAEWIQAATGGKNLRYPWGNDWEFANASNGQQGGAFVATGLYSKNESPAGAMDMSGNVYEWCLNAYDGIADPALDRETERATKGGAYFTHASSRPFSHALSVYHRYKDNPWGLTLARDNPRSTRIAAGIRPVCVGLDPTNPAIAAEDRT